VPTGRHANYLRKLRYFMKILFWTSSAPLDETIGFFGQRLDYGLSPIPTDSKNQKEEKIHFQDF
jgi:hypothetical protein